jgi:hypothetical protein
MKKCIIFKMLSAKYEVKLEVFKACCEDGAREGIYKDGVVWQRAGNGGQERALGSWKACWRTTG